MNTINSKFYIFKILDLYRDLYLSSGNTDWSRTQLGWGQFNHFQSGEYGSSHTGGHQHGSHATQNTQSSSTTNTVAATPDWYDQGYDYVPHSQLNYHRSVGGIF